LGRTRRSQGTGPTSPTRLKADPDNYIAQPTIQFSTAPCLIGDRIEPRHVDLRPFILSGEKIVVTPGALTRVALKQAARWWSIPARAAARKDTWVLAEENGHNGNGANGHADKGASQ
jgi:uncharacterized circularly permuted ATP-grasp superfamily protein